MFFPFLEHYGTGHEGHVPHSGRFPWMSGEKWRKRPGDWVKNALDQEKYFREHPEAKDDPDLYKKYGIKPDDSVEVATAKLLSLSSGEYRALKSIRKQEQKLIDIRKAVEMQDNGASVTDISKELGLPWSTVKTYLKPGAMVSASKTRTIADGLLKELQEKKYLDVGEGVERQLGISEEQLFKALMMLQDDGYKVFSDKNGEFDPDYKSIRVRQATNPDAKTTFMVLTEPDVSREELWENREKIVSPDGIRFEDYGSELRTREPIKCIDSDRIMVRYAEDHGTDKDGVIELRPGVEDLSLGGRTYAQVRIGVDGTHYLKGMAVYGYDMPEGVDVIFNTNKHKGTPMCGPEGNTVLKILKNDPNNPFGSNTTQWDYIGADGAESQSPIEIVNEDKDWAKWKKSLPSQVLSKQPVELAVRQLDLAYRQKEQELQEILAINNPTVRKQMLAEFSDSCDRDSVELKAAALPRQATKVLLPVTSLKEDEIYAPDYEQGESVALIRFPHAGTFEIAKCRVNNNNEEAKTVLGTHPAHAVGVNPAVSGILSGADFDGDTVLVIPTAGQNLRIDPPLEGLKGFDPKETYRKSADAQKTGEEDGFIKGRYMGDITNLITDMTMMAASKAGGLNENDLSEITRAVRHSMVVIDAEKHNLDWKKSYEDNQIAELKIKYQGGVRKGAATLISRAGGEGSVPEREEINQLWKMTEEEKERWKNGEKIYHETGHTYVKKDKDGNIVTDRYGNPKMVPNVTKGDKLALVSDAYELASPYLMDTVYAEHSNKLKALANQARKEERSTPNMKLNKEASKVYEEEVKSLKTKLNEAALNAPRERQAQAIANKAVAEAIKKDPSLARKNDKDAADKLKKRRAREIESARALTGAKRKPLDITEKEWQAIEAGAITDNALKGILRYADKTQVKKLASGRSTPALNAAKEARARSLLNAGWTQKDVAEELGVSISTLRRQLNNFNGIGGA